MKCRPGRSPKKTNPEPEPDVRAARRPVKVRPSRAAQRPRDASCPVPERPRRPFSARARQVSCPSRHQVVVRHRSRPAWGGAAAVWACGGRRLMCPVSRGAGVGRRSEAAPDAAARLVTQARRTLCHRSPSPCQSESQEPLLGVTGATP